MKFKLLLLPVLIASMTAYATDDKATNALTADSFVSEQSSNLVNNGELLKPGANGEIDQFGGATRLKAERTEALKASLSNRKVKNVILFIGDGTSDSEITSARNYAKGASGYFKGLDAFPITGAYTTYALQKGSNKIDYVTDSAASASAWATGVKTYNNALGVDSYGTPHESILKLAKRNGYATGNITTAEIEDATPAALISSISHRSCFGPDTTSKNCPTEGLESNGLGSIAEQLLQVRADVTLGGGAETFNEKAKAGKYKNKTLLTQAKAQNYQITTDLDSLNAIKVANQNQPVLGLFAAHDMPVNLKGPIATIGGNKLAPAKCEANPERTKSIPSLSAMTSKAIDLLSANKNGFFLQVESGSVDKENHKSNACGQIGETVVLDDAVQVALEFAKKNPDTLIIVTGDHGHTSQIIPSDTKSDSLGRTVALQTFDNVPMVMNYGTSTDIKHQQHTGVQVHTAAYGPNAANFAGLIDQTDMFFIMKNAFGFK